LGRLQLADVVAGVIHEIAQGERLIGQFRAGIVGTQFYSLSFSLAIFQYRYMENIKPIANTAMYPMNINIRSA
jgi:hypothetical protein